LKKGLLRRDASGALIVSTPPIPFLSADISEGEGIHIKQASTTQYSSNVKIRPISEKIFGGYGGNIYFCHRKTITSIENNCNNERNDQGNDLLPSALGSYASKTGGAFFEVSSKNGCAFFDLLLQLKKVCDREL
jgi:hypothetical protein